MNKIKFILAFIAIAIFVTACDKKENGDEDQDTTPKETKVTLTYKVTATNLSPIFNADISYKNENNQRSCQKLIVKKKECYKDIVIQ